MNKKIKTEAVDHLFQAILTLKNLEECYIFFEDVCTVNELLSLSQRYEVAKMLREKKTYLEIAEKTGASTATISRVNRSLNYGNDGYEWYLPDCRKRTGKNKGCPVLKHYKESIRKSADFSAFFLCRENQHLIPREADRSSFLPSVFSNTHQRTAR